MSYYDKYIKYKAKYIKYFLYLKGGSQQDELKAYYNDINTKLPCKLTEHKTDNGNLINIISIEKDESKKKNKPNLIMIPGFSTKSFIKSANILLKPKFDKLLDIFNIHLIEYASYKSQQTEACKIRDAMKKDDKDRYKSETDLNQNIAIEINKIIKNTLKLTNVHLLGKCAGGGISIHLLEKDPIYTALYLAVPGNPRGVKYLKNIEKSRLKDITFIFCWCKQDHYKFDWNKLSKDEITRYDKQMNKIKKKIKLKYNSYIEDKFVEPSLTEYHEIPDLLIEKIIENCHA